MRLSAADERMHGSDGTAGWCEHWRLDVASADGLGVAVMLACSPARQTAWWWTHVLVPGFRGPVVVRDHDVPRPRVGLEVRADGLWGEQACETPFEHWTYGLEAFGVRLDDPSDSLRGEVGERLPVGFDLEWEVDPAVGDVQERAGSVPGYDQFGTVHGEVLLGRTRTAVDAVGLRSHAWGVPRWDARTEGCWVRAADASAIAVAEAAPAGWTAHEVGAFVAPVDGPAGQRATVERALCRFDGPAGAHGIGWSSRFTV